MSRTTAYFTVLTGLLTLALLPGLVIPSNYFADKILHLCICILLLIWAFFIFKTPKSILLITSLLLVGSLGVEIIQSAIPGRSMSFDDVVANLTGISLGWLIGHFLKTAQETKHSERKS
jgi:VanZ family protein